MIRLRSVFENSCHSKDCLDVAHFVLGVSKSRAPLKLDNRCRTIWSYSAAWNSMMAAQVAGSTKVVSKPLNATVVAIRLTSLLFAWKTKQIMCTGRVSCLSVFNTKFVLLNFPRDWCVHQKNFVPLTVRTSRLNESVTVVLERYLRLYASNATAFLLHSRVCWTEKCGRLCHLCAAPYWVFVPAATFSRPLCFTHRPLLVSSPSVFLYFSGLLLKENYAHLIFVAAPCEFAELAVTSFLHGLLCSQWSYLQWNLLANLLCWTSQASTWLLTLWFGKLWIVFNCWQRLKRLSFGWFFFHEIDFPVQNPLLFYLVLRAPSSYTSVQHFLA